MNKRSAGGSFPRFGRQWFVALALLAAIVLGTSIAEGPIRSHPSHDAPIPASGTPAAASEGSSFPVPAASEVFSNAPSPSSVEVIPSF
ncbi:hypothetical protein WKW77_03460 [Variovorax ureilyticus]|uniref:Uncharacterized protein n=1 Tax=Variovorax ureilyticus TaxID=1836198 RepID=A0ABU8VA77_9BURK